MADLTPEQEVHAQTDAMSTAAEALVRDRAARDRVEQIGKTALRLAVVSVIVVILLTAANLVTVALILRSTNQTRDISKQSVQNGAAIKKVLEVTDPSSPAGQAAATRAAAAISVILKEIDCRTRRAIALLPPPPIDANGNPLAPCVLPKAGP